MDIYAIIGLVVTIVLAWVAANAVALIRQLKQNSEFSLILSTSQAAVLYVEQKFPDLFGDEKLREAIGWSLNELALRGIDLDESRITPMLESQVKLLLNSISAEFISSTVDAAVDGDDGTDGE